MSNAPALSVRAFVEQIMGLPVSVHVRAHDTGRADIAAAVADVFARLARADAVFSTWRADSDLMRWRRGDLALADADPSMRTVMQLCERATSATGGLFTTDLIGPDGTRGWDPTGLVKGWAVDEASERLRGVDRITFSINAGGDIVCGVGSNATDLERPWNIGIEDPRNRATLAGVMPLVDGALATSSCAARGAHIVDPRSGLAVAHEGSATLTGPDLVWADVWATATFLDPTALDHSDGWSEYRLWRVGY